MRFLIYNEVVKRIVLILTVLGLLLLSQAVVLWAAHADGMPEAGLKAGVSKTRPQQAVVSDIKVAGTEFYYRLDEKARFIQLKNQWQSDHRGELPLDQARAFSKTAYTQASVEEVLNQWRYHGGPSPWVFVGKAHLYNEGEKAYLNVPITVTYRAKVGDLRVNSALQMTDFNHLQRSAHWKNLPQSNRQTIPAIAPGEDILLELGQINLLEVLTDYPNRWPAEIEVQISSPMFTTVSKAIALTPDHFLTPTIY